MGAGGGALRREGETKYREAEVPVMVRQVKTLTHWEGRKVRTWTAGMEGAVGAPPTSE